MRVLASVFGEVNAPVADPVACCHWRSIERLGRCGDERVDLFDRHREEWRRVDSRQPHTVAWVASAEQAVVERRVEHAGHALHHDPHSVRSQRQPADERLHVALADRSDRPVAEVGDRVTQPFLDRAVRARPPVATLAIPQRNLGERCSAEPRRGVGARQQPVLHVDQVPLGIGLTLERLRPLLARSTIS